MEHDLVGKPIWLKYDIETNNRDTFYAGTQLTVIAYRNGEYDAADEKGRIASVRDRHFITTPPKG